LVLLDRPQVAPAPHRGFFPSSTRHASAPRTGTSATGHPVDVVLAEASAGHRRACDAM